MLNYNHLYYFYQVARHQSVTRAAKFLSIQQPSLSAQIKVLESQIGQDLFERVGRELRLSSRGQILFRYCQRIFDAAADLENYLRGQSQQQIRSLRIGVTEQIDQNFVADLVSHVQGFSFDENFQLKVVSGEKSFLVEQLKSHKIDLLFSNNPTYEVDLYPLSEVRMPVVLFVSSSDAPKATLDRNHIAVKTWLKKTKLGIALPSEKLKLRHETDQFLQKFNIKNSVVFESDLISVVARAVVDGVGFAFLPMPYLAEEMNRGLVATVSSLRGFWSHQLYLIGRQAEQKDPLHLKIKNAIGEMKKSPMLFFSPRKKEPAKVQPKV